MERERRMTSFKRARSTDQKIERMEEIKAVTSKLFDKHPYHEITLSTIGDNLGWSRANLYKYVSSKEEIFLQLADDARHAYYEDLLSEFSNCKNLDVERIAKRWAKISEKNMEWSTLGAILVSIVEKNVGIELLKKFKKGYYDEVDTLAKEISPNLKILEQDFADLYNTIHYHAVGLCGICTSNPLVKQAIEELGIKRKNVNYKKEMEKFILMCLKAYQN